MTLGQLEHLNYTVEDPRKSAEKLCKIFGWKIRWEGPSLGQGRSVHVGTDDLYLALYSPPEDVSDRPDNYKTRGGLNHIGVLVDDLDAVEDRVKAAGYHTHSHQTYDPGSRFYFHDENGIEFEVVSYAG